MDLEDSNAPTLYQYCTREEALALVGSGCVPETLYGDWVVFPHVLLCFATVGNAPRLSYFPLSSHFCWVAPEPLALPYGDEFAEDRSFWPLGVDGRRLPIILFARPLGSNSFRCLGHLEPSSSGGTASLENGFLYLTGAEARLYPTLPSQVWAELGWPERVDNPEATAALDEALQRLGTDLRVEQRLEILQQLVEYWHGSPEAEDGYTEQELQGLDLPYPLHWWYRRYGKHRVVEQSGDWWLEPAALEHGEDGRIIFLYENAGSFRWATTCGADPPVWVQLNEEGEPWHLEEEPLSGFLIQRCFAGLVWAPYSDETGRVPRSVVDQVVSMIPPVPLGRSLRPIPEWDETTYYCAKNGVFLKVEVVPVDPKESHFYLSAFARTEHPLRILKSIEGLDWYAIDSCVRLTGLQIGISASGGATLSAARNE
jgi:hypothetical protein